MQEAQDGDGVLVDTTRDESDQPFVLDWFRPRFVANDTHPWIICITGTGAEVNDFDDLEDAVDYLRMINAPGSHYKTDPNFNFAIRHRYFGARYTRNKIAELDI